MGCVIKHIVKEDDLAKLANAKYIELHLTTPNGNVGRIIKCWTQKYFDENETED